MTTIRWLIKRDMPEILAIEREAFPDPWQEHEFLRVLSRPDCIAMVADIDGRVAGFMVYELGVHRVRLLNFAVARRWRRWGVGASMMDKLKAKLSAKRRTRITLEVRETNLPAQLFFRSQGFHAVRVLRGRYEGSEEDAYAMVYRVRSEMLTAAEAMQR